jgi:hypothetical protein
MHTQAWGGSGPESIGYFITPVAAGWHGVKTGPGDAYILARFDNNWYQSGPFGNSPNALFSSVYLDSGTANTATRQAEYRVKPSPLPWASTKHYIVTNTDGTTGLPGNVSRAQFWNTNAADQAGVADNVATANFSQAPDTLNNAQARFHDGDYIINIVAANERVVNFGTGTKVKVRLDNFFQTVGLGRGPLQPAPDGIPVATDTPNDVPYNADFVPVPQVAAITSSFQPGDKVGISGTQYLPNQLMYAYIVPHKATGWMEGDSLSGPAVNRSVVLSDSNGNVSLTDSGWTAPTTPGTYDVIIDYNNDGKFSWTLDGLSAFTVTTSTPPVANDDTATVAENGSVAIPVLANDSDPSGNPLSISSVTPGANGTVAITADGVVYTPKANWYGADTFSYSITNGNGAYATAKVSVTVNKVNLPPVATADSYILSADGTLTVSAADGVLANDTDPNGSSLTATLLSGPSVGTLDLQSDGSFTYSTPLGFVGKTTFTYQVTNGSGQTSTATVTLSTTSTISGRVWSDLVGSGIQNGSNPPVANVPISLIDASSEDEETVASTTTGADGTYQFTGVSPGSYILQIDTQNDLTVANQGSDPALDSDFDPNSESVSLDVDAGQQVTNVDAGILPYTKPNSTADFYATDRGQALTVTATNGVLANDTDPDGNPLQAVLVDTVQSGTLDFHTDGSFTYTPAPGDAGEVTFTYRAADGNGLGDPTLVTIRLVDSPPVANNVSVSTNENVAANVDVLSNDWDPDGDALSVVSAGDGEYGTVTINNGIVTYSPEPYWSGTDTFWYGVTDGFGNIAYATVNVTVNPVNQAPSFTAGSDETVNENSGQQVVSSWATNISAGPPDESNQTLTFHVSNDNNALFSVQPTIDASGNLTYAPAPEATGTANVSVSLQDNGGTANGGQDTSATQTFTITINPANDPPVANNSSLMTPRSTPLSIDLRNLVSDEETPLANLSFAISNPLNGTVTFQPDGHTVLFTPSANYHGTAAGFSYSVTDTGNGPAAPQTTQATVSISVDSPPVANNDAATTMQGVPTTILVLANDTDPDADMLSIVSTTQPAHGTASIQNGAIFYTPNANFTGTDSFQYTISDGYGGTATATVSVTVMSNIMFPPPPPPPPAGMGSVTGFVWNDVNANGIDDPGEGSFGTSLQVNLLDMNGNVVATTWTMAGMYSFSGINNGQYRVQIILPTGYAFSPEYQGTSSNSSDVDANGISAALTVNGMTSFSINAGVHSV